MSFCCLLPSLSSSRMSFGIIKESPVAVHARPSFLAACQKPLATEAMPFSIFRRTYSTACRWSGIRQKCSTCTSVWCWGMLFRQSTNASPKAVRATKALAGSPSGMASLPNTGCRSVTVRVI